MEPMILMALPQTMAENPVGFAAAGILGLVVCAVLLVQILRCGKR